MYPKYRASGWEVRPQAFKSENTDFATSNMAHSTTTVVSPFPGFANLGARKDQSFTKNRLAARKQGNSPVVPLQYDIGKKEQYVRAGYLMPDEELHTSEMDQLFVNTFLVCTLYKTCYVSQHAPRGDKVHWHCSHSYSHHQPCKVYYITIINNTTQYTYGCGHVITQLLISYSMHKRLLLAPLRHRGIRHFEI